MDLKKLKKWLYQHQVETLVIIISFFACMIGTLTIGIKAFIIVVILDFLVLFGPKLYELYLNKSKTGGIMKKTNIIKNEKLVKENISAAKTNMKKMIKKHDVRTKTNSKKVVKKSKFKLFLKLSLMLIFIFSLAGLIGGAVFFSYIVKKAPTFNPDELYKSEASILYSNDGKTVIAKLGAEKREKITYNDLPEVFVDALVATEDSRFFQHNGFDLPRFVKASIGQVLGSSNAGGASTLTMQVSKNAFTSNEDEGLAGIVRKFTDIYMSIFQIEKKYTKEEIIEFYVNNNLLGGNNYGVEQASLAYFGKSAKNMNLSEAALIAGIFQAPNTYNPLTNPDNAAYRRSIVLRLMVRHGYITQAEADAANAIEIADLIKNSSSSGDDTIYQGFVDTVVSEVKKDTGLNPYTTAMIIYTTMDISKQNTVNDVISGKTYAWENPVVQAGITVLDTKTGAIVAIGTNRDNSKSGLLNHATFENQTKRQIGSTAKPLFDYGPAVEYNNATPGQLVVDEEYAYSDGTPIQNFDGGYKGVMTYRNALAGSRNITALKVFQSVKKSSIIEFTTNLGLTPEINSNSVHEAHAIGGYTGESPTTLAAAYAAFGNGGKYNKPYSYTKLIYRDSDEEYVNELESKVAMSEATAYIVQDMLITTAKTGLLNYGNVNGFTFGAKTGTSNFNEATKKANNLSDIAINDLWLAGVTDEYTIAVWYGYDKIDTTYHSKFGDIQNLVMFNTVAKGIWTRSHNTTMPSSVVNVTVESQAISPVLPSANTPDSLKTTELFKKGAEPTEVSKRFSQLANVTNLKATSSEGQISLTWTGITANWLNTDYLTNYYKPLFNSAGFLNNYVSNVVGWNSANLGNLTYDIYEKNTSGNYVKVGSTSNTSYKFIPTSTGTSQIMVKAAYSSYKANQSSGAVIVSPINGTVSYSVTVKSATISKATGSYDPNDVTVSSDTCTLKEISVNNVVAGSNWTSANTAIKALNVGTYATGLKVSYTCGGNTVTGIGSLTITN